MTKEEFLIKYVLARANAVSESGLNGEYAAYNAEAAWAEIQKRSKG